MITELGLLKSLGLTPLKFCLCGSMNGEVYRRRMATLDELLAHICHAAAHTKKRKGGESEREISHRNCHVCRSSLWDFVTFIMHCNKFVIFVQEICNLNINLK
jgi:hypothetical protein